MPGFYTCALCYIPFSVIQNKMLIFRKKAYSGRRPPPSVLSLYAFINVDTCERPLTSAMELCPHETSDSPCSLSGETTYHCFFFII